METMDIIIDITMDIEIERMNMMGVDVTLGINGKVRIRRRWSNIIKWMVEKKDDWFSEEADRTRKLFKVRKSWKLEVKDDVFLVDPEDPYTPYSIPKWVFVVMDWEEYSLYEDQLYWEDDYNNSFNSQPIEDGVDKDN